MRRDNMYGSIYIKKLTYPLTYLFMARHGPCMTLPFSSFNLTKSFSLLETEKLHNGQASQADDKHCKYMYLRYITVLTMVHA